jgi:uncharacterized membrane protein
LYGRSGIHDKRRVANWTLFENCTAIAREQAEVMTYRIFILAFPKSHIFELAAQFAQQATFTPINIQRMNEHPFKKLLRYFLQGLLTLAPIIITIWAVTAMFNLIDGLLPNLLYKFFPHLIGTDSDGIPRRIPGLGFIVVILLVLLVGYISSSFLVKSLLDLFGRALERAPGIKIIYTTVKDFFEAFAGDKKKFNKPVLVNVSDGEAWQIGFITQPHATEFGLQDYIAVYIPFSYSIAGQLFFVPSHKIKMVDNVSSTDAMKFVISGGVTHIDEPHAGLPVIKEP